MTPKDPKFKFTIGKGKSQGDSLTQEIQAQKEIGEGEEEENEDEVQEEEEYELENEQGQDEGEFDEEGLPEIPSTSQSQETHEGIPPTSCDTIGTTSIFVIDAIPLGYTMSFPSQALEIHVISSTSTSESSLDTHHDNLDTMFLSNSSKVTSSMLEDFENFMSKKKVPP